MEPKNMTCKGGSDVGCSSCAYREGSPTREEPYNVLRAEIAAEGGIPFHCHQNFPYLDRLPEKQELVVCEGWKKAVAEKAKDPHWRTMREAKGAIARLAMGLVEEFTNAENDTAKRAALADLRMTLKALFKKPKRSSVAACIIVFVAASLSAQTSKHAQGIRQQLPVIKDGCAEWKQLVDHSVRFCAKVQDQKLLKSNTEFEHCQWESTGPSFHWNWVCHSTYRYLRCPEPETSYDEGCQVITAKHAEEKSVHADDRKAAGK
jgi:hypothetical protein